MFNKVWGQNSTAFGEPSGTTCILQQGVTPPKVRGGLESSQNSKPMSLQGTKQIWSGDLHFLKLYQHLREALAWTFGSLVWPFGLTASIEAHLCPTMSRYASTFTSTSKKMDGRWPTWHRRRRKKRTVTLSTCRNHSDVQSDKVTHPSAVFISCICVQSCLTGHTYSALW